MRKLVNLETAARARSLGASLARQGVANEIRDNTDGTHGVWVLEEGQLGDARAVHAAWLEGPIESVEETPTAAPPEQGEARAFPTSARPPAQPKQRGVYLSLRLRSAGAPLTMAVLIISGLVALITDFGTRTDVLQHFTITSHLATPGHDYDDLRAGELWRLVTPVFVHFGFLHLVFNAFWLLDLGAVIERLWGGTRLAVMLLVSAVLSNAAQLYFGQSPAFGGLSGLVYACAGYLWARGRFDPSSPVGAPPQLMTFFLVYLALGFSGVLDGLAGKMANYCHLGGLIAGAGCGLLAALSSRLRLRRSTQP